MRQQMAPLATQAAWHLGDWTRMGAYAEAVGENEGMRAGKGYAPGKGDGRRTAVAQPIIGGGGSRSVSGGGGGAASSAIGFTNVDFFRAVLAVRRGDTEEARVHIATARDALGADLAALVTESYDRSYGGMVCVQQLTELEEVIEYTELGRQAAMGQQGLGSIGAAGMSEGEQQTAATRRELMRQMWRDRIYGVQRKVEVWQALLAVRSLVLPATEETGTWLKFASLNRKAGRTRQAQRTLLRLLGYDPASRAPGQPGYGAGSGRPEVMLAYVKHQWSLGNRRDAFARLQSLVGELGCVILPPETYPSTDPPRFFRFLRPLFPVFVVVVTRRCLAGFAAAEGDVNIIP